MTDQNINRKSTVQRDTLPKRVGVVFIEESGTINPKLKIIYNRISKKQEKPRLDFDQIACAHLVLQMNYVQCLFDFEITTMKFIESNKLSKTDNNILTLFTSQINKLEEGDKGKSYDIDYWIGVTSEQLTNNLFFAIYEGLLKSNKSLGIITSRDWEKQNSPPSLFEYIALTLFTCSLGCLSHDFNRLIDTHHNTRGCIFDYTSFKPYRRILVSNPNLCSECKRKILNLESNIQDQTGTKISIYNETLNVLSKTWMGSTNRRSTPLYEIKRNYGYDVDRNSGHFKTPWEKAKDNFKENSIQYVSVAGISAVITFFINYINSMYHIKP